jgi:hypothetical protein
MHPHARVFRNLLAAAALAPAVLFAAGSSDHSGYLKDYSQLKPVTDPSGEGLQRWSSVKLSPDTYKAVIIEPVVLYPKPDGSEKVSAETLTAIAAYMTDAVKQHVGQNVKIVDHAGPGVARVSTALTSIDSGKRGLKPYQFVPIALVATTLKRAAVGAPVDAKLFVETEITDSVSGEPLLRVVREGTVKDVPATDAGDKPVTLDLLKPLIDRWAADAARNSTNLVSAK